MKDRSPCKHCERPTSRLCRDCREPVCRECANYRQCHDCFDGTVFGTVEDWDLSQPDKTTLRNNYNMKTDQEVVIVDSATLEGQAFSIRWQVPGKKPVWGGSHLSSCRIDDRSRMIRNTTTTATTTTVE